MSRVTASTVTKQAARATQIAASTVWRVDESTVQQQKMTASTRESRSSNRIVCGTGSCSEIYARYISARTAVAAQTINACMGHSEPCRAGQLDVQEAVRESVGKPVKIEHKGVDVGKVVSAWVNNGKLDMLLEVDPSVLEGALISDLVRAGACRELSLGYNVSMLASARGEDIAGKKSVVEVSLVRKGDRHD
eukprot:1015063-Rhodomonas_salina.1